MPEEKLESETTHDFPFSEKAPLSREYDVNANIGARLMLLGEKLRTIKTDVSRIEDKIDTFIASFNTAKSRNFAVIVPTIVAIVIGVSTAFFWLLDQILKMNPT